MREVIADAFRMTDVWRRRANPWSVYTRFAAIAIWSRTWIGWWCLLPIALVMVWLWLNPRVFSPVIRPAAWASKGIYGERIWAVDRAAVPAGHRMAFRLIAIPGLVGLALTGWGLLELDVWPTVFGATLVVMAQLWRIDGCVDVRGAHATAVVTAYAW